MFALYANETIPKIINTVFKMRFIFRNTCKIIKKIKLKKSIV